MEKRDSLTNLSTARRGGGVGEGKEKKIEVNGEKDNVEEDNDGDGNIVPRSSTQQ